MSFCLDPEEARRRSVETAYVDDSGVVMTEQSHRDSCDINVIMKKYEKSGLISHVSDVNPNYGDFTQVSDYHSARNQLIAADAAFMTLDAKVRKFFDNDPARFLEFMANPQNAEKAIELGLATRKPGPDATLKDVVEAVKSTKGPSVSKKPKVEA